MAALCVADDRDVSWYWTMTSALEERTVFYKQADWSDIVAYDQSHNLVTGWTRYPNA